MAMGGPDQDSLRDKANMTEMECAVKLADLAERYAIPVTLFITGRAAQEESSALLDLSGNPYIEIGGHTWNGLQPPWKHTLYERIHRSYFGPSRFQRSDIMATLNKIEIVTKERPASWRTHAYRGDPTTNRILNELGCCVVSDAVGPRMEAKQITRSLWSLPLNTPPDHDHVLHGAFTQDWHIKEKTIRRQPWKVFTTVEHLPFWKRALKEFLKKGIGIRTPPKPFGDIYLPKEEWVTWLQRSTIERLANPGHATLQLHPACMELLDGMTWVRAHFEYLQDFDCYFANQLPELLGANRS